MSISVKVRNSFLAGLILVAPLAVTVFVLQFVFGWMTGILNPIVRATSLTAYTGNIEVVAQLLAAALLLGAIAAAGFLASWSIGQRLFGGFERGVRFIPIVRTVYFGVQQVGQSLSRSNTGYDRVALVEYPRRGIYAVGFVTNEAPRETTVTTEEPLYSVFLPNSPNPTAGRLILVPESQLVELDMNVKRGLRLLVTTGLSVDNGEVEVVDALADGVAD